MPGIGVHPYQDRFLNGLDAMEPQLLFAVADGVTHSRPLNSDGGVAAGAAISLLRDADPELTLADAVRGVHRKMLEMKRHVPIIGETTIVAARITGDVVNIVNVGDSPAHLVRDSKLRRLYRADLGWGGFLSQTMGYDEHVNVHQSRARLQPGDILVLGSDGIMKHIRSYIQPQDPKERKRTEGMYITRTILTANGIREIVEGNKYISVAAEELLNEVSSKRPDAFDDKTVIMIRVNEGD